ncbi:unnamed protein product [Larinioides sclopetarius]|uniref:Zinc finger PHD-type domain-containing protein n=1 Tax=Larinioides sclopetarius TaxID=280406 RepID=A0AAV2AAN3_9ARAC
MERQQKRIVVSSGDQNNSSHSQGSPPQNSLLLFCDLILKYEKYKIDKEELDDESFSSSGSERTNDSFSSENENNEDKYSNEDGKTDSDQDDSWNLITCYCMKPFRGRPMIECTQCGTWIHMSCAKIRPNNVPDVFICQFCRKPKDTKRRSERIRSEDRRFS